MSLLFALLCCYAACMLCAVVLASAVMAWMQARSFLPRREQSGGIA